MDPEACLTEFNNAIQENDVISAEDSMDAYKNWRDMGGFEPVVETHMGNMDGDDYFDILVEEFESKFSNLV